MGVDGRNYQLGPKRYPFVTELIKCSRFGGLPAKMEV